MVEKLLLVWLDEFGVGRDALVALSELQLGLRL